MAEEPGGTNFLAFVLGGVVVVVIILFFLLGGVDLFRGGGGGGSDINVDVELPAAPEAPAN